MDPGKEVEELEVQTCLALVVHATTVQEVVSVNILLNLGLFRRVYGCFTDKIQRTFILVIHWK